jgi:hypothetical protein
MTLMIETAAPVAKPFARPRSRRAETVSASALALHLDCSRAYIGKLEAEGVIERQVDGFSGRPKPRCLPPLPATRAAAITAQRGRRALIDALAGITLTHLSGMAARCSNDLAVRRKIDAVVYEVRKEMANDALEMADKCGEPPLSEQGQRAARSVSKVQLVDQRMCLWNAVVSFRQLRTCSRTRPGQLCAIAGSRRIAAALALCGTN